jgi:nickel-dependent lactate racemase
VVRSLDSFKSADPTNPRPDKPTKTILEPSNPKIHIDTLTKAFKKFSIYTMNKTLELTYGNEKISISVPRDFLAGELIKTRKSSGKMTEAKMKAKMNEAIRNPVDSPPIGKMVNGTKVGLVINDEFRSGLQELIVSVMIKEIFDGSPERLDIFIANGTHDPEVYCKNLIVAIEKIARGFNREVGIFVNKCDSGEYINLGKTLLGTNAEVSKKWLETEVRIYAHESKYHYMNGYSVFDKQVCPGLSSRRTIESTHKQALEHDLSAAGRIIYHQDGKRKKNPFARDNRDVRLLSERFILREDTLREEKIPTFLLDMFSTKSTIEWIAAGNPDEVSVRMTKAIDDLASFVLSRTKYVVISPGGPPACNALYSVQNCFDMALKYAIKEGGEALILAPCTGRPGLAEEARGLATSLKSKALFWDNLVRLRKLPLAEATDWIDRNFELYLWKTDRVLKLMLQQKIKFYLYSKLPAEKIEPGGFISVSDPNEWIAERAKRNDGKLRVIDEGNKLLVIPSE